MARRVPIHYGKFESHVEIPRGKEEEKPSARKVEEGGYEGKKVPKSKTLCDFSTTTFHASRNKRERKNCGENLTVVTKYVGACKMKQDTGTDRAKAEQRPTTRKKCKDIQSHLSRGGEKTENGETGNPPVTVHQN